MKNRSATSLAENENFTPAVFSRVESALNNSRSQESVIIQCPHCQTKFSLDGGRLDGIENPRFHCSRCDQVFNHQDASVLTTQILQPSKPVETSELQKNQSSFSIPKGLDKGYQSEPPIDAAPHLSFDSNSSLRMNIEKSTTESSSHLEPAQIEFLFNDMPTPDVKSAPLPTEKAELSSLPIIHKTVTERESERPVIANDIFDEIEKSRKQAVSEAQALNNRSALCSIVDMDKPASTTLDPKVPSASILKDITSAEISRLAKQTAIQTSLSDAPKRKPPMNAWQSFLLLSAALTIFVGIFALLGVTLVSSPKFAQAFTEKFAPSAPVSPPAGLMIAESSFRVISLDNGETVSVISGKLVNHTEKTLKEVMIDGIAFDAQGEEIASVRGRASSPLSSTRLKSLSLEMIQMLQSRGGTKKFVLKPDASVPFSIVITQPKAEEAASFIARIYSVNF